MGVMLPYQRAWMFDRSPVKVWEKSRRIGASWCDAADSALVAAKAKSEGGMSTYYLSYNKDMTQQYVKDCADWAKRYHLAASDDSPSQYILCQLSPPTVRNSKFTI